MHKCNLSFFFALIWIIAPSTQTNTANTNTPIISDQAATTIVNTHCTACHASNPSHPAFQAPPAGIELESLSLLAVHADKVHQVAVDSHYMPLGNLTGMSEEERQQLGQWLRANKP